MVIDYRLSNVLLTDGVRSENYPDMYVRTTSPAYDREDGVTVIADPTYTKLDFLTFFNAFSNAKWQRYTVIDNVHLHLNVRGTFDINLVACDQGASYPVISVLATQHVEHGDFAVAEFAFPESDALMLGFQIISHGTVEIKDACYFTKIDESSIRNVELAVAMTTFKNEQFVVPNIELFKQILACDEPVAQHLTLHVIDNGQSLDVAALEAERVHIHPNPNVGGAGGFTRGMLEAMEQTPKATHVLLMDDDVQVSPESIKRTFNIASLVNDDYVDAFTSGAMMSIERQDEFYEDLGYIKRSGAPGPVKHRETEGLYARNEFIVSNLEDFVRVEALQTQRNNQYAGWWYCCIPMTSIERNGLPLPIFIRCDDMEYGNRSADRFITMNGICVWHIMFGAKYRLALERYQALRNSLIIQATTGVFQNVDYLGDMHVKVYLDFKNFNYTGVELSIMAIEDFLKGPEFIKHVNAADLNARLASMNPTLTPIDEIDDPLLDGVDYNVLRLFETTGRSLTDRAYDLLTFNGQRGPKMLARGGVGVVSYDSWSYSPSEIRGKDAVLAIAPGGVEGVLFKKDRQRFNTLFKRYKATMKTFDERRDEVYAQWAAARDELTSIEFWKWYLEDQAKPTDA